jgi:hypothetical protein
MLTSRSRWTHPVQLVVRACIAALILGPSASATAQSLPARISDSTFWRMVSDMSEPGGYFRSDNFVSNETSYQYVIARLNALTPPGGVYVGVGPDQNFTYIVAMRPRIAFVVDIRRQNMIEHLMYKADIEMSADRAEFLSRLFARPRPSGLDSTSTPEALFNAYYGVPPDTGLARRNFEAIRDRLVKEHGFTLSGDDVKSLEYVFNAFLVGGPDLTYSGPYGASGRGVTYAQLMEATDGQGLHRSYLASEANYRALREIETNNLLVPLVGDFAGPKALKAVGQYVRDHGAIVTTLYTSNVEQYLFQQQDDWRRFFTNVGTMPVDSTSMFIRSVFGGSMRGGFAAGGTGSLLSSITELLRAFTEGRILSYGDVIAMSR